MALQQICQHIPIFVKKKENKTLHNDLKAYLHAPYT